LAVSATPPGVVLHQPLAAGPCASRGERSPKGVGRGPPSALPKAAPASGQSRHGKPSRYRRLNSLSGPEKNIKQSSIKTLCCTPFPLMQTCGLTRPRHAVGCVRRLCPLPHSGVPPAPRRRAPPRGVDVKQPPGEGPGSPGTPDRGPGQVPGPWGPRSRIPDPGSPGWPGGPSPRGRPRSGNLDPGGSRTPSR